MTVGPVVESSSSILPISTAMATSPASASAASTSSGLGGASGSGAGGSSPSSTSGPAVYFSTKTWDKIGGPKRWGQLLLEWPRQGSALPGRGTHLKCGGLGGLVGQSEDDP